jgi:hypothetical protein
MEGCWATYATSIARTEGPAITKPARVRAATVTPAPIVNQKLNIFDGFVPPVRRNSSSVSIVTHSEN